MARVEWRWYYWRQYKTKVSQDNMVFARAVPLFKVFVSNPHELGTEDRMRLTGLIYLIVVMVFVHKCTPLSYCLKTLVSYSPRSRSRPTRRLFEERRKTIVIFPEVFHKCRIQSEYIRPKCGIYQSQKDLILHKAVEIWPICLLIVNLTSKYMGL